jgi:NAD(P)-dependent dehydrogenase (short-subunit alcohol dehydrogenase family)
MPESRVIVMTGASSGLGLTMTLALLGAGHRIVAVGRDPEAMKRLGKTASDGGFAERLVLVPADIRSVEACEAVVERATSAYGGIDILVNNAGANISAKISERFFDVSLDDWRTVIDTNLNGPFFLARLVAPLLVARGWGRIVNHVTSFPTMARAAYTPYGPSKAALEAATAAWAAELAGTGVTVNAILPGGGADTRRMPVEPGQDRSNLVAPAAMVGPMLWLASTASDAVTGMRVVAKEWSPHASEAENVARAVRPAWHNH